VVQDRDKFGLLESICARDIGRGSERLAQFTKGSLQRAAQSIAATPRATVVIITGFFIPEAVPPAAETDGPLGAAQLAGALTAMDIPVRILTDEPCGLAVRTAISAYDIEVPIDCAPVLPIEARSADQWAQIQARKYASMVPPVVHMVSIERVGPSPDGIERNMRAQDIRAHTAPLHEIFSRGLWNTIGIGDGGNELGMGKLPVNLIDSVVKNGGKIRCVVSCDELIVAGTSNWGAAALVAALSMVDTARRSQIVRYLDPAWARAVLVRMVETGAAVDGVTRTSTVSVDGLDWAEFSRTLEAMNHLVGI
jgi:hypothetical protein